MSRLALQQAISDAFKELTSDELDFEVSIERPAADFGDWSCNIAMVAAKKLGKSPLEIANSLAEILNRDSLAQMERVEVAPPGFLNFYMKNDWLYDFIDAVVEAGQNAFQHSFGAGEKIILEFVSANPTGPLHAGHAKGAIFGDSLARVLKRCGYGVQTETYINDLGSQIDLYVGSLKARATGTELPEGGYRGTYIEEWAEEFKLSQDIGARDIKERAIKAQDIKEWGIKRSLADHAETLKALDINFDNWFSESSLKTSGQIEKILKDLNEKSMIYEEDGASWLKTSDYGDDKNRVLVKSDGSATYLLPDIAYHQDKLSRADRLINIWGADHHGYVARVKAALLSLGMEASRLEIIISQLVRLESDGQEVKISKRAGDIILLSDLLELLGSDVVRFTFLLHSSDSAQTVDLKKAAAKSMDNPVYYVQYAHTRICSIFAKVETADLKPDSKPNLSLLTHPRELELMRVLTEMPDLIERVAKEMTPHHLTSYLGELAGAFHSFYHDCRVSGQDNETGAEISSELTQARLKLLKATQIGLTVGLDLCGVSAPKEM